MMSTANAAAHQLATRRRRATPQDAEVGRRVRSRRLEQRLSQTDLADGIGVTFQQVQKYEKGTNRIGAGRLQRISKVLNVSPSFFFDDGTTMEHRVGVSIFGVVQTRDSVELLRAFTMIKNHTVRRALVALTCEYAEAAAKV